MDFENNNINEEGISISELWNIFKSRFAWFLLTLILVVAGAIVYLQYAVPQYSSKVTILVEPIASSSSLDSFMMGDMSAGSSKIATEVELITSKLNIAEAMSLLDLSKYKNSDGVAYSDYEKVYGNPFSISSNSDKISVSTVKDTKLVSITITDQNPEFATDFANALSASYDTLLSRIAKNSKTSQRVFLEEQIPINEDELTVAADKLSDYKEESGVLQLTEKSSMLINQISYYELKKEPLKLQQIEASSTIDSIAENLKEKNINIPTAAELTNDSEFKKLVNDYLASESEYVMYSSVNASVATNNISTDLAPRVSELKSSLNSIQNKMLANLNEKLNKYTTNNILVSSLLSEYSRNVLTYEICNISLSVLDSRSAQYNKELDQLPILERQVLKLQRDVTVLEQIGVQLRTMLEEVKLVEASVTGNVTLVDKATVPKKPVSPNTLLILAVALLLGAALGFLLALVIDMADNTIKTTDQLRNILKGTTIPLLGWVPLLKNQTFHPNSKKNEGYKNLSVYNNPTSFESEKYMTIVSNILFSGEISKNRVITVTSCDVSEGKSSLVANMALSLTNMGHKVLIVDGDLRMPSIEAKFGYTRAEVGLVNFIQEEDVKLKDIVVQPIEEIPLLHILPPGRLPLVPIAILSNPKMSFLNDLVGKEYDYILIDAPPLEYASEVLVFGERYDSLLVNVRANITTKPSLKILLQSLQKIESKIVGVVLNACLIKDAENTSNASGKYGYGYSNKYGYASRYGSKNDYGGNQISQRMINSKRKAISIYKKSLKFRSVRDSAWEKKHKVAPLANIDTVIKDDKSDSNAELNNSSTRKKEDHKVSKDNKQNNESVTLSIEIDESENVVNNTEKQENSDKKNYETTTLSGESDSIAKPDLNNKDNSSEKQKEINYDDIFKRLENDPLASGKETEKDTENKKD